MISERHSYDEWRALLRARDDRLTLDELHATLLLDQCAYLRALTDAATETRAAVAQIEAHTNRLNNGRGHNLEVWLVLLSRWLRAVLGQTIGGPPLPLYPETTANRPEYDEIKTMLEGTWERQDATIASATAALLRHGGVPHG